MAQRRQIHLVNEYAGLLEILEQKTGQPGRKIVEQSLRLYGWIIMQYEQGNEVLKSAAQKQCADMLPERSTPHKRSRKRGH